MGKRVNMGRAEVSRLAGRGAMSGEACEGSAQAYRPNYRVVRYGFMQIRQKLQRSEVEGGWMWEGSSFGINGGRTNVPRFFC